MSSERPSKRVRQACEPCRRKKSRCPGEKPTCSYCARLKQNCFYANDNSHVHSSPQTSSARGTPVQNHWPSEPLSTSEPRLEDRVKLLEARLSGVLSGRAALVENEPTATSSPAPSLQVSRNALNPRTLHSSLPSWDTIEAAGQAFVLYCDSQPLPLFNRPTFVQTLPDRDPEVLFSILALALRFTDDRGIQKSELDIIKYVEAARTIVSKKVFDGTVELSTIQSLCLLSLVDFTNGNTRRASIHSSLAMNLAHNAELTTETYTSLSHVEKEERRRCFWSLFLLKRLHGADFSILDFTGEENFPYYPSTPDGPLKLDEEQDVSYKTPLAEKGVMAYAIQMSQVWFKITKYARRRGKPSTLPPWSPQSEYSIILAEQMDCETRMPYTHRFRPARFSQRTTEELHNNRDYWGPWLFLQLVYHTNLCLLNHPLLLSLRLRNFKSMIPEIFLQHTSDLISSHASWVLHIIEMLNSKQFKVTDPFLGYCVAIVATIFLQESFIDDVEKRKEKEGSFETCLNFVRGLGEQWPHVSRIAIKLQKLAETVSATYVVTAVENQQQPSQQTDSRSHSQTPNRHLLIDLAQFWEILEYSSASEVPGSASLLFGSSLYSTSPPGSKGTRRRGRGSEGESGNLLAQTSPLPEPTRVERQDFAGVGSASGSGSNVPSPGLIPGHISSASLGAAFNVVGNPNNYSVGSGGTGPAAGNDLAFVYSDDELAVLAESFFNQGQGGQTGGGYQGGMGNNVGLPGSGYFHQRFEGEGSGSGGGVADWWSVGNL